MKVKNSKLHETANVLAELPAFQKAPKGTYGLTINLKKMRDHLEVVEESRKKIWKEHFGDEQEIKSDHPKRRQYTEAWQEILDTEVEFDLHMMKTEHLNLDMNTISPKDFSTIFWMFEDKEPG